ncbi:MAG: hypothetical protein JW908_11225 [Anaerolineales bacterium]|nr:hypothetical protein [Anaerolineales bacterium]
MDSFEFSDQRPARNIINVLVNILTVFVLIGTLCNGGIMASIFLNPYSGFNPFPPPTLPSVMVMPSLTPTAVQVLPPTWTPIPSATPLPSNTPLPEQPTVTPMPVYTASITPTNPPADAMPFALNAGSPVAISSVAFHPEAGCNWMGIAGQVLNMSGAPVSTGVIIRVSGELGGVKKDITSLTGTARQYGEAGYEIVLGTTPIESRNSLWVQLLDQAGLPMSPRVVFDTYASCDQNLIFITFKQIK